MFFYVMKIDELIRPWFKYAFLLSLGYTEAKKIPEKLIYRQVFQKTKGHGKYLPQFADICSRSLKMKPLSVRLNLTYVFNAPWPKDFKYVSQFIVSGSVCAWEKSKALKAAFNCLFHTKPKILPMKAMIVFTIKGSF